MGNKVKKTFMKKFNAHGYTNENGEKYFEWCELFSWKADCRKDLSSCLEKTGKRKDTS